LILADAHVLPVGPHVGKQEDHRRVDADDVDRVVGFGFVVIRASVCCSKSLMLWIVVILALFAFVVRFVVDIAIDVIGQRYVLVGDRPLFAGAIVAGNVGRQVHRYEIEFSAHIGGPAQRKWAGMVKGEIFDAVCRREFDAPVDPSDQQTRRRTEQVAVFLVIWAGAVLGCSKLLLLLLLWYRVLQLLLVAVDAIEPVQKMGSH